MASAIMERFCERKLFPVTPVRVDTYKGTYTFALASVQKVSEGLRAL